MMEFILASANAHKAVELEELLNIAGISVKPSETKFEILEDGETFQDNSLLKAQGYFEKLGKPTVADDSGLVVESMPEILGVQSARFAPELPDYKDKNNKLIEMMKNMDGQERQAYFVCVLCFYISPEEIFFFEGRVHGTIGSKIEGSDGFGYDPIFLPDGQEGKSMAQLAQWKMKNSHRAKACEAAVNFFKK